MLIRKAVHADTQALKAVARRVVLDNYTPFLGADMTSAFIASGESDREIDEGLDSCTIMEAEHEIIGFAITKADLLHLLMVDTPFQNKGYGSLLLQHVEHKLFKAYPHIRLQTFKENGPAVAFYEKNGWDVVSEQWMPEMNKTMLGLEKASANALADNEKDRDDYIRQVTIGEQPENVEILLAEYSPAWPALFEREAGRIRDALRGKALQIHHVGSTSVPGLCAKPIIDILLIVKDSSDEPDYLPEMTTAGYTLRIREPDWFEHRMFKGPGADINLHVFSEGCEEPARMLAFRDRLRTSEDDRELYANAKRDLAKRSFRYVQNYADAKSEVVAEIMARIGTDKS